MNLKPGVRARRIASELVLVLQVADEVRRNQHDGHSITVTSINDGRHGIASLHFIGHAVDIRTNDMENPEAYLALLRKALGDNPDFDLVLEDFQPGRRKRNEHLHIEFQPKSNR